MEFTSDTSRYFKLQLFATDVVELKIQHIKFVLDSPSSVVVPGALTPLAGAPNRLPAARRVASSPCVTLPRTMLGSAGAKEAGRPEFAAHMSPVLSRRRRRTRRTPNATPEIAPTVAPTAPKPTPMRSVKGGGWATSCEWPMHISGG
mmetsp:Transcript_24075/g.77720  ORF Transcript_24075/g.77720 Transcript_24075/m.77720 type:complete len:147 (+) Transcript_24075:185-625(+)